MSEFSLDDPSFYEDFLVEAQEHFELIEQNFLALEEDAGNLDILNAIFRSVHTIKGASGFLGLQKVQSLSHIGENVLDDLRKGRMAVNDEVMELLFETTDTLKVLVNDVGIQLRKSGTASDPEITDLVRRLELLRSGGAGASPATSAAAQGSAGGSLLDLPPELAGLDESTRSVGAEAVRSGAEVVLIRVELHSAIFGTPFNPMSLLSMVELVGRLVYSSNLMRLQYSLDDFAPEEFPFDLILLVQPTESLDAVKKLFAGVKNVTITYYPLTLKAADAAAAPAPPSASLPLPTASSVAAPAAAEVQDAPLAVEAPAEHLPGKATERPQAPEKADKSGSDTIRVNAAKLDSFMNTVAELIISKTMINHIVERFETLSLSSDAEEMVKDLRKSAVYLDQVSKEIQASVLGIRMVPVKTIFTKFPRMLRDLAKASGKKIELQMVGEDTEIDKSLIEELGDPMIHLIRNSADHGVETPEVRQKAGKSETGLVTLRARHEGDSVIVEIEDDGKGIDPSVIRAKAVEKGLITPERAESMSDEEAVDMVFLPGFSTAAKVTDISGRGVGMDVVRSNVRKLNGSVGVKSVVGKGSIFTLKLPLTLAIIDALLMRAGGQVFALPGTAVEETILVPRESVSYLTRRKAINLRGEVLGVTRLRELLRFREDQDELDAESDLPVVVVSAGGRRMGIIVDRFLRRTEMVIKPLAPYLASLPGISGASIMGDGGVVLILDPAELIQLAVQEAL